MTVIDLNETYKIRDYKYILSCKVLDTTSQAIACHLRPSEGLGSRHLFFRVLLL